MPQTKPQLDKEEITVAIITVATIAHPSVIKKDTESKEQLVKHLKEGFKILFATPTHAQDTACITYILEKQ